MANEGPDYTLVRRWYRGWYKWVAAWLTTLSTPEQPIFALIATQVSSEYVITDLATLGGGVLGQLLYMSVVVFIATVVIRVIRSWRSGAGEQPPDTEQAQES